MGEVEARRGNVCGLASVALKGGPGLGRWAGFDAVYAPLIIEVAENECKNVIQPRSKSIVITINLRPYVSANGGE